MAVCSCERINNAIHHKPNDRPPYNFRAEPEVYAALAERLGLGTDEAVRVWACSDIRDAGSMFAQGGYGPYTGFGWTDRAIGNGVQSDIWGVGYKRVDYKGGSYLERCHSPLEGATPREVMDYDWPDPEGAYDFACLPDMVRSADPDHEYWWVMEGESLFDRTWTVRGMEQLMTDMLTEPELADFMLSKMADFFFRRTRMILEAAHGWLDAIDLSNDLGTQNGMMISPAAYRTFLKPHQKRLIEMIKSYGAHVFYHSCGGAEAVFDDLIEIGVDIIDPLQMKAMGVTPEHLAERYGGRITFHGGLDTQGFMQKATPEAVAAEVDHLLRTFGRDNGYVLSGSHYYQVDIPIENIIAVTDTVKSGSR